MFLNNNSLFNYFLFFNNFKFKNLNLNQKEYNLDFLTDIFFEFNGYICS